MVIVDLTRCTFLELTIIASLLSARSRMRVELAMPPAGSLAERALDITGLPGLFATHRSLDEALTHTHPSKASL